MSHNERMNLNDCQFVVEPGSTRILQQLQNLIVALFFRDRNRITKLGSILKQPVNINGYPWLIAPVHRRAQSRMPGLGVDEVVVSKAPGNK